MTPNEIRLLELNEGRRNRVYKDSVGKLTIGVGFNLSDNPLPEEVIDLLRDISWEEHCKAAKAAFPWIADRPIIERTVLYDLAFNMGIEGLKKFKNTLKAWEAGDLESAARGLEKSLWYKQVGKRGPRMVGMLRSGEWPWDA